MYDLYCIFMLAISWVLGMLIFSACFIALLKMKWSRRMMLRAAMTWATDIMEYSFKKDESETEAVE